MHKHGGDIYQLTKKVLDFSINVNPLGMPERVRRAAKKGVVESHRYPDVTYNKLVVAIAEQEDCFAHQVVCGNGAADLIFNLVRSINPKRALILAPGFYEYEQALNSVGCQVDVFLLEKETSFSLYGQSLQEQFLKQIKEDTDLIFLCNPNNPTGMLTDKAFLNLVLKKCQEQGTLLVVDECFMDFVDEHKNQSMVQETKNQENLIVLKAFTKIYAIPGLRLGYMITGNEKILTHMGEISQPWSVSIPAEKAGIAALKEEKYRRRTVKLIQKEKQFLGEQLARLPITVYQGEANFLLFFSENKSLQEACLKRNILIRDCSNFQGLSPGYYRICVRKRRENKKLITALQEVL